MGAPVKATNEQIVDAYRTHGSVWKSAKALGMCGQSVWERLRAIGHPLSSPTWDAEELAELANLAGQCTIGEIAKRLGRPYYGVALKLSRTGTATRFGNRQRKVPRGAGLDKATVKRLAEQLGQASGSLRQFCRANGLSLEPFVLAMQKHEPLAWRAYS